MNDDMNYIARAKELVRECINEESNENPINWPDNEMEVLWCVWTPKHWAVLINTPKGGTFHYEVSHSNETETSHVNVYAKVNTHVIPD